MSIVHFGEYCNPSCDLCGHMLPAAFSDEGARAAMQADGWEERDGTDICALCLRTERETGKLPEKYLFRRKS